MSVYDEMAERCDTIAKQAKSEAGPVAAAIAELAILVGGLWKLEAVSDKARKGLL